MAAIVTKEAALQRLPALVRARNQMATTVKRAMSSRPSSEAEELLVSRLRGEFRRLDTQVDSVLREFRRSAMKAVRAGKLTTDQATEAIRHAEGGGGLSALPLAFWAAVAAIAIFAPPMIIRAVGDVVVQIETARASIAAWLRAEATGDADAAERAASVLSLQRSANGSVFGAVGSIGLLLGLAALGLSVLKG